MTETQALRLHARAQDLSDAGNHRRALAALDRVADYFRSIDAPADLANIEDDRVESLLGLCRYKDAEAAARRAVKLLTPVAHLLDRETAGLLLPRAWGLWGACLRELGKYEDARSKTREAVDLARKHCGRSHQQTATQLNNLGMVCKYGGWFAEGRRVYLRALAILEAEFGVDSLETASIWHNLGGLEHSRGRFSAGEPLGRKAYEIRRKHLGEDHPATVADAVAWCGLLDGLGRFAESEPIYRRALAYYERTLGRNHFEVAATLNNLAMVRASLGDRDEAIKLMERCVAIKVRLFGERHPEVRLSRRTLRRLR
jgi:tetratricopeptide (TPR) repeat protein